MAVSAAFIIYIYQLFPNYLLNFIITDCLNLLYYFLFNFNQFKIVILGRIIHINLSILAII